MDAMRTVWIRELQKNFDEAGPRSFQPGAVATFIRYAFVKETFTCFAENVF